MIIFRIFSNIILSRNNDIIENVLLELNSDTEGRGGSGQGKFAVLRHQTSLLFLWKK